MLITTARLIFTFSSARRIIILFHDEAGRAPLMSAYIYYDISATLHVHHASQVMICQFIINDIARGRFSRSGLTAA